MSHQVCSRCHQAHCISEYRANMSVCAACRSKADQKKREHLSVSTFESERLCSRCHVIQPVARYGASASVCNNCRHASRKRQRHERDQTGSSTVSPASPGSVSALSQEAAQLCLQATSYSRARHQPPPQSSSTEHTDSSMVLPASPASFSALNQEATKLCTQAISLCTTRHHNLQPQSGNTDQSASSTVLLTSPASSIDVSELSQEAPKLCVQATSDGHHNLQPQSSATCVGTESLDYDFDGLVLSLDDLRDLDDLFAQAGSQKPSQLEPSDPCQYSSNHIARLVSCETATILRGLSPVE